MNLILGTLAILIFSTKNPVKLSTLILILGSLIFLLMWLTTGMTWVPLILSLLFTGGILIMFMIFSTFHPNEGTSKMSKKSLMVILLMMPTLYLSLKSSNLQPYNPSLTKVWFQSVSSSLFVTLLIILYFNMFMKILKKEENCMKMLIC